MHPGFCKGKLDHELLLLVVLQRILHFGAALLKIPQQGFSPSPRDWFNVVDLPELQQSVTAPCTTIAYQSHTCGLGIATSKVVSEGNKTTRCCDLPLAPCETQLGRSHAGAAKENLNYTKQVLEQRAVHKAIASRAQGAWC